MNGPCLCGDPYCPRCYPGGPQDSEGEGDFSIGSDVWPGLGKVVEEAGELIEVLGKIVGLAGSTAHWSGEDMRERLYEELGDLLAACEYFIETNGFDDFAIDQRKHEKLSLFRKWHEESR